MLVEGGVPRDLRERTDEGKVRTGEKGPPRGLEGRSGEDGARAPDDGLLRAGEDGACAFDDGLLWDLEDRVSRRGSPWGVIDFEADRVVTGEADCGGDAGRRREAIGEDLSHCVSGNAMIKN